LKNSDFELDYSLQHAAGCLLIKFLRALGALAVPSFFARCNSETAEPRKREDRKEPFF
jgi:hypothetical protein